MFRIACALLCLAASLYPAVGLTAATYADAGAKRQFVCGGEIERQVWSIWDNDVRNYLENDLLRSRLKVKGDVYALYDFQTLAHNAAAMARRCNNDLRLRELAQLISIAYDALSPGTYFSPGRRWICRGGSICNNTNRLLNTEVMLDSAQFLGLATTVANALATSGNLSNSDSVAKLFIQQTTEISIEHLLRWNTTFSIEKWNKLYRATPKDITDGSSSLFFSDKPLWLIAIYGELSGILQSSSGQTGNLTERDIKKLRSQLDTMLKLFLKRVSLRTISESRIGNVTVADIDRGYWRLYSDNAYAGYEGQQAPVTCASSGTNGPVASPIFNIPASSATRREDTGWDLSHARRLVHAFDSLSRNRKAIQATFGIGDRDLPADQLYSAFANNLIALVWNGNISEPLFANYWSGANGWYRVAYDNGTGECQKGYPPFGLTDSFVTGGYITWSKYRPEIGLLGKQIYMLADDPDSSSSLFLQRYYPDLSAKAGQQAKALAKFMFLPTLVGVGIEPEK